jgi:hypothetical protein
MFTEHAGSRNRYLQLQSPLSKLLKEKKNRCLVSKQLASGEQSSCPKSEVLQTVPTTPGSYPGREEARGFHVFAYHHRTLHLIIIHNMSVYLGDHY